MLERTKQAEQVAGRLFIATGYIQHVAEFGVYASPSDYDDITDSQATLIYLCAKDPEMQDLAARVLERADEIEVENDLEKARPWWNLAKHLEKLAALVGAR